jgi:FkbM family methyltransferase
VDFLALLRSNKPVRTDFDSQDLGVGPESRDEDFNRVVPLLDLLRRARTHLEGWWWLVPTIALIMPGRVPPRKGLNVLGDKEVLTRTRQGDQIRCRIDEAYGLIEVFVERTYDAPEIPWNQLRTVVDIGANIGAASIWLARQSPGRILAVEPATDTCTRLEENLRRNELLSRVDVLQAAVGDAPGHARMEVAARAGRFANNSRLRRTVSAGDAGPNTVPQVDLDMVVERAGSPIDLMKIDCEGGEYAFLTGASTSALRKISILIGEYHAAHQEEQQRMFSRLRTEGFSCRITPARRINDLEEGMFLALRGAGRKS